VQNRAPEAGTESRTGDANVQRRSRFRALRRSNLRLRRGIGSRLLVRVLLFSSVVTLFLTLFELYVDYRLDVNSIKQRLFEIDASYCQSMSEGLWNLDRQQLQLQVNGILSHPSIRFVEVRETTNRVSPIVVAAGQRQSVDVLRQIVPLYHTVQGRQQKLGVLVVEATLDDVYRSLVHRGTVILISQAAKTFLVSFFILYITYLLVTRHLVGLAGFLGSYDLRERRPAFRLKRRQSEQRDELDQVVSAFGTMRSRLEHLYDDLRRREEDYRGIYENALEGIVRIAKDGKVLSANPALANIFGGASADELVQTLSDFGRQCWRDPGEWVTLVTALCDHGTAVGREAELLRLDGRHIWVSISARAVWGVDGELLFFEAIISDVTMRKEMATALLDSQQRFRDYAETASDWFWETDAAHALTYLSEQFGVSVAGLATPIGKRRWDFADDLESEPDKWLEYQATLARHQSFRDFVYRLRSASGEIRFFSVSGKPVWDTQNRFCGYRGVTRDVTRRVRADEDLRASLLFFESMDRVNRAIQGTDELKPMMGDALDNVLSIFDCDRAWVIYPRDPQGLSWQPLVERMSASCSGAFTQGLSRLVDAEIVSVFKLVSDSNDAVSFGPGLEQPLPAGLAQCFEVRAMIGMALRPRVDQPYLFVVQQCSRARVWTTHEKRLFIEIGRRLGDALTSLLSLQNLRDSEAKLESAQRIALLGYWDRDLDTDHVIWSAETYRIFGLPAQATKITFANVIESIHPDDRTLIERAIAAAVDGKSRIDLEFRVVRPDGDIRTVRSQGDLLTDTSGRPRRLFGTIQDITARKHAEQRLAESELRYREMQSTLAHWNRLATVGQFTAEIAHEIKQPLAAAAANAAAARNWLRAQPPNYDEAARALSTIVDDTLRASAVIGRVRKLVTKAPVGEELLSINDAMQDVLALVAREAEKNNVRVSTALAPDLPLIVGDRVQLQQVALNLISNAIEAMSSCTGHRELRICTAMNSPEAVLITVQDSGPGLAQETIDVVFDPFYTTKADGMGMGLSICQAIVRAHGGRIWASENTPRGAIFGVVLPAGDSHRNRPARFNA
jgi:PAS domain S-box-containing protein